MLLTTSGVKNREEFKGVCWNWDWRPLFLVQKVVRPRDNPVPNLYVEGACHTVVLLHVPINVPKVSAISSCNSAPCSSCWPSHSSPCLPAFSPLALPVPLPFVHLLSPFVPLHPSWPIPMQLPWALYLIGAVCSVADCCCCGTKMFHLQAHPHL